MQLSRTYGPPDTDSGGMAIIGQSCMATSGQNSMSADKRDATSPSDRQISCDDRLNRGAGQASVGASTAASAARSLSRSRRVGQP